MIDKFPKKILLDTCALLWLATADERLKSVLSIIQQADTVYISAISGFEVALKYQKGKLGLPLDPSVWFRQMLQFHDLTLLSLDLGTCIQSTQLDFHHNDPCDRFIIATAILHNLPVITADSIFQKYPMQLIKV